MRYLTRALAALSIPSLVAFPSPVLAQSEDTLEEVVVTATRTERPASEDLAPTTVVNRRDIEESNAESVQEILQQSVPGLQMTSNGGMGKSTGLHLRGTNSEHVLVLIDGIKHNSATSGGAAIEHLPLEQVERIEVVQGPRSSLYGSEALGGVIQIFTRKGKEGVHSNAKVSYGSYDTRKATAGLRGGSDGTRYSANLSYLESEWINVQEGNNPDDDGYENASASVSLEQDVGEGGSLKLSGLHAEGTSEYDGDYPAYYDPNNPTDYETDFVEQSAQIRYGHMIGSLWRTTVQFGESRDEQDYLEDGEQTAHYDTRRTEGSWENQFFPTGNQEVLIGADYRLDRVDAAGEDFFGNPWDSSSDFREDNRENRAVFGNWSWNPESFQGQLGLRYDDNEAYGDHTTGDVTLGYRLTQELRLVGSYGTAFKAPTFNQLYSPLLGGYGNPDLEAETSQTKEVGLLGDHSWGSWEIRTYETQIQDLIQTVSTGTGTYEARNVEDARIRGLELSAEVSQRGWRIRPSLTFLDPENENSANQLARRAEQTAKMDVQRQWDHWSLGGSVFAQSERYNDADNTEELAGYGLVNLRGGYRFADSWQIRAKANNLLDKDYQTAKGYNQPGRNYFVSLSYGAR